mgnify:FL=1
MGYRINVVLTGSENIGEALKAISEGKQVPYDSTVYDAWDDAVKVRNMAMVYFPAATIEVV